MVLTVTILVILAIMVAAGAVSVVVSRRQEKQSRYMAVISGAKGGFSGGGDARDKQIAKQRADIARKLKQAGQDKAEKKKDTATIREMMMQAGIEAPVSRYWLLSAAFAVIVFLFLKLIHWPNIAVILITFTAFLGVPRLVLKIKAGRRQRDFLSEFPDALDASVRLLQAGMPITEAISMASREFSGSLRDEMTRMHENQKIGLALGAAAMEMARRVPLPEVHMFATALQIQSETGSSLSEVLSNLSAVIRARFRLKRKVKALSSEAKASASIIAALPVLVSLGLYAANEKYISVLFNTSLGNFWLGVAIFWMMCGVIIMRQMINFKV